MIPHDLNRPNITPDSTLYSYPLALRDMVLAAPATPGVYTFHGATNDYPLYIGKSINLRARLLSHLRSADEARLLKQTSRISYILCAGEISALLLEAKMIKEKQPLFNRRLRKTRSACSIIFNQPTACIKHTDELEYGRADNIYGLFKNQRTAIDRLRLLADEHGLCLGILGLEKISNNRGCFRSAIRKCAGACCGKEDINSHNRRAKKALEEYRIAVWPYTGAIALRESHGRLKEFHVLNNWHYYGSYKSLPSISKQQAQKSTIFDADMYKILVKPILNGDAEIIQL